MAGYKTQAPLWILVLSIYPCGIKASKDDTNSSKRPFMDSHMAILLDIEKLYFRPNQQNSRRCSRPHLAGSGNRNIPCWQETRAEIHQHSGMPPFINIRRDTALRLCYRARFQQQRPWEHYRGRRSTRRLGRLWHFGTAVCLSRYLRSLLRINILL